MQILFCDNHILILCKPQGVSTQPHGEGLNATDFAKAYLKKRFNKPGRVFLEPIHRLDTPVSGLVLFARTSKALSRLQEQMRERAIQRIYFALTESAPPSEQGLLEHYLFHDEHRARVVSSSYPEAKKAQLQYKVLGQKNGHTQLEIQLITGRYHQIRAQLTHIGCPVVGDTKYGGASKKKRVYLHHGRLQFMHPVTQESLSFEASPDW